MEWKTWKRWLVGEGDGMRMGEVVCGEVNVRPPLSLRRSVRAAVRPSAYFQKVVGGQIRPPPPSDPMHQDALRCVA